MLQSESVGGRNKRTSAARARLRGKVLTITNDYSRLAFDSVYYLPDR